MQHYPNRSSYMTSASLALVIYALVGLLSGFVSVDTARALDDARQVTVQSVVGSHAGAAKPHTDGDPLTWVKSVSEFDRSGDRGTHELPVSKSVIAPVRFACFSARAPPG